MVEEEGRVGDRGELTVPPHWIGRTSEGDTQWVTGKGKKKKKRLGGLGPDLPLPEQWPLQIPGI